MTETIQQADPHGGVVPSHAQIARLIDSGHRDEARDELVKLLAVDQADSRAHNDLGVLLYNDGKVFQALYHYEEAVRLSPENNTYAKNLADLYCLELGRLEDGIKLYLKILEASPHDTEVLMALGHISALLGNRSDAEQFFERVLILSPWHEEAREALANLCGEAASVQSTGEKMPAAASAGEPEVDQRIEGLERQLLENPTHAATHNDLGVLYYQRGDLLRALFHYERAVRYAPESGTYAKNLADFYSVELDKQAEALEIYVQLLKVNPQDAEALLAVGHICLAIGNPDDGLFFARKVLALEPWNDQARHIVDHIGAA